MERLTLEGNRYIAILLDAEKREEEDYRYSCWHTAPDMWWEGNAIITNKTTGKEVRTTFETFRRANVEGGIKAETLEESVLLVRGRTADGGFVSHKGGGDIVLDRPEVVDYLFDGVYGEASAIARVKFMPHVRIPLLEQADLAERGYAKPEEAAA